MQIFLVGGAVRDQLLGVDSNDHDYVIVGSTQAEVEGQTGFSPVGKSFPVYLDPKTGDEYALARRERKTGVGYNGFAVDFGRDVTLAEDLYRRDLTINAIAFDTHTNKYIDPYNGRLDLEHRVLRHVSPAFAEDPLRVIRLARFYARFSDRNFTIHPDTAALARTVVASGELDDLPDERHWAELQKVFVASVGIADFFAALWNLDVLNNVRFYRDLLGTVSFSQVVGDYPLYELHVKKALAKGELAAGAAASFVALATSADRTQDSVAIPTQVKELTDNLWTVRSLASPTNAVELLAFLGGVRAWNNLPRSFEQLLSVMKLAARAGEKFTLTPASLKKVCDTARLVKPKLDANLTGAQVGQALKKDRLAAIKLLLDN